MSFVTPKNHSTRICLGISGGHQSAPKQGQFVSVSTTRSEDVSIDNSQVIEVSNRTRKSTSSYPSPRNSALSPSKSRKAPMPVLNEQGTASTHSSDDSLFHRVDDDSEAPPINQYATQPTHNDPTRHVSNLGHAQSHQQQQHQVPRESSQRHVSSAIMHSPSIDNVPEQEATSPFGLDYTRLDEDSDQAAAWAIHVALILFCSLVFTSLVLSFVVIDNYGFLTLVILSVLVGFCLCLAWFVDKTVLQQNEKLKPIRNQIVVAVETAKQAVADELDLFKNDWSEFHLLLTNGEDTDEEEEKGVENAQATPKMKRKKSVLFKMVKPFLGGRRKLLKRKKNKNKSASSTTQVELV